MFSKLVFKLLPILEVKICSLFGVLVSKLGHLGICGLGGAFGRLFLAGGQQGNSGKGGNGGFGQGNGTHGNLSGLGVKRGKASARLW